MNSRKTHVSMFVTWNSLNLTTRLVTLFYTTFGMNMLMIIIFSCLVGYQAKHLSAPQTAPNQILAKHILEKSKTKMQLNN